MNSFANDIDKMSADVQKGANKGVDILAQVGANMAKDKRLGRAWRKMAWGAVRLPLVPFTTVHAVTKSGIEGAASGLAIAVAIVGITAWPKLNDFVDDNSMEKQMASVEQVRSSGERAYTAQEEEMLEKRFGVKLGGSSVSDKVVSVKSQATNMRNLVFKADSM